MPKIKQAAISEIHWKFRTWNQGADANARLRQLIGEDARSFARVSLGPTDIFWNDDAPGWICVNAATPEEQVKIDAEYRRISDILHSRAPKYADALLTFPNDDYLFFRFGPDGAAHLLFTGWGYSNYKKASGSAIRRDFVASASRHPAILPAHEEEAIPPHEPEVLPPPLPEIPTPEPEPEPKPKYKPEAKPADYNIWKELAVALLCLAGVAAVGWLLGNLCPMLYNALYL